MASPAIEVTDLRIRYGARTAVDGVSFALPRGRVLALLGTNGAGKTSTVEACEGFRRPDGGTVRVLGADPHYHHYNLIPHVGVMLQAGGIYPGVRAGEFLDLLASFAARPADVPALVERLGLAGVLRTPYRRLSGGEKQRLGLALALVGRPVVALLDEPTAGMDPPARRSAVELIEQFRAAGGAVLLTTHLLDDAERLADEVVILHAGRVAAAGPPAALTAAAGIDRLWVQTSPGLPLPAVRATLPVGCQVAEPAPGEYVVSGVAAELLGAVVAAVTDWCRDHGAVLTGVHTERRTLADVFLELVDRAAA